jgi:predicted Rossmann fold nucleotide-binding protein DprA/Smf involved in DNA uptake
MKLAVVGSRNFNDYWYLTTVLDEMNESNPITLIISGGAKGADELAYQYAVQHNIPYQEFPADWETYGKKAGPMRNKQIIEACDQAIAFWDGESSGTRSSIRFAEEQGKDCRIVLFDIDPL